MAARNRETFLDPMTTGHPAVPGRAFPAHTVAGACPNKRGVQFPVGKHVGHPIEREPFADRAQVESHALDQNTDTAA